MKKILVCISAVFLLFSMAACSDNTGSISTNDSENDYRYDDYDYNFKISESTLKDVATSEVAYAVYNKIQLNQYSYGCDPERTRVEYTDYDIQEGYSYSTVIVRGKCWLYNSYNEYADDFKFDCKVEINNDGTVKQCYFPTISFY